MWRNLCPGVWGEKRSDELREGNRGDGGVRKILRRNIHCSGRGESAACQRSQLAGEHCFGACLKEDNAFYYHSKRTYENSSWAPHQARRESDVTFCNDCPTFKLRRFRISFVFVCSQWSCLSLEVQSSAWLIWLTGWAIFIKLPKEMKSVFALQVTKYVTGLDNNIA